MPKLWTLPIVLVFGLLGASSALATGQDTNATVSVIAQPGGLYVLTLQDTGDSDIDGFTVQPGPALTISAVKLTTGVGSCAPANGALTCSVALVPPQCACTPGTIFTATFSGSGGLAGTTVVIGDGTVITPLVSGAAVTPASPPTTTTSAQSVPVAKNTLAEKAAKAKAKTRAKKVAPVCRKGQHSTKLKPCRKQT